jgi:multimeric flavodoxin WrbA
LKIIAVNGSPRKNGNTATLLNKALEGAATEGTEVELIHLYDLNYKGCICCLSCKLRNGPSYGKCAIQDDLTPIFRKIEESDALILGSPVYYGSITGEMESFFERLTYQWSVYGVQLSSAFPKKLPTGFIYTMNAGEEIGQELFGKRFELLAGVLAGVFGSTESLFAYDAFQFNDYSKYVCEFYDPLRKAKQREKMFPLDCEKAFMMGKRFATKAKKT